MVQDPEVDGVTVCRSQRIFCSPAPTEDSSQKSCSPGSAGVALPGTSRYRDIIGPPLADVKTVWCTLARYRSTSASGPTPMKIGVALSADSATSRRLTRSKGTAAVLFRSVVSSIGGDTSAKDWAATFTVGV